MQEFTNTSKETNCSCVYDNQCHRQVLNNGFCDHKCGDYDNKYKLLPEQIKQYYLKEQGISITDYDKCMELYKNISNNFISRIMLLVDNINTCIQYGYDDWFPDLYGVYNKEIYFLGTLTNKVIGIVYCQNKYELEITDTVKLKDGVLYKKTKDIVKFKDLLTTFEDKYNQFEKEMYDVIYKHLGE